MATVALQFSAPAEDNAAKLRIFESAVKDGPFLMIEEVSDVGTSPDYIDSYTTTAADDLSDWFMLQWLDVDGAILMQTLPQKNGAGTLVAVVIERVLQRDRSLDEEVVRQEAEAAIEEYFGSSDAPYDPAGDISYKILNGLVYLTMARSYVFERATSSESVTIGMVSLRQSSDGGKSVDNLIKLANVALGLNTSVILQMAAIRRRYCPVQVLEV